MSYERINFKQGTVLHASELNLIDRQVLAVSQVISETIRQASKTATFPLYTIKGNIAVLGDSTISGYPSYPAVSTYLGVGSGYTITDIATPSDTLTGQLKKWNNIDTTTKQNLNYIFCQIGLNDVDETKETFRNQYKALIAKIRADAPNAKLILGTMIPCEGRWQVLFPNDEDVQQSRQENWEYANNDIMNGYYDCDAVAYLHTDALGLNGWLRPEYDHGDKIHENSAGGKVVAYSWCATAFGNAKL